jgi:hypothetical protein
MEFYHRNEYPKCIEQLWEKEPEKGQRVEIECGATTNNNVWWDGEKFVNKYGFELHNILGWRPYNDEISKIVE